MTTNDDSGDDGNSLWMWLFFFAVLVAMGGFAAYWYWCQQEKLALHYPPYPLRCDDNYNVSDAGGIEPATRVMPGPRVDMESAVASGLQAAMTAAPRGEGSAADAWADIPSESPPEAGDDYDPENVERVARWDISALDGSWWADNMRRGISLSGKEGSDVYRRLRTLNQTEGVLGFHRLGLAYLGHTAFDIATPGPDALRVPFCPGTSYLPPSPRNAYMYFTLIEQECRPLGIVNLPVDGDDWRSAIRSWFPRGKPAFDAIDRDSPNILARLMDFHRPDLEKDNPEHRRKFCLGLPSSGPPTASCQSTTKARQALKLGDAAQAAGNLDKARSCWLSATKIAQIDPEGAEAGMIAQQRLQSAASTCKPTKEGLAAISRDYKARSGDLIRIMVLKHALKALGHYDGPLDDRLSEETRAAIARFQSEREEDQTGTLTPEQTTMLICSAAESTRDVVAETTLGVMYIIGLGVGQNIDQAHDWLTEASSRKHPDATYNLAILYGTGIVLNSYRLCDVSRSPEQADRYLQEAAYQGHPEAQRLYAEFGPGSRYVGLSPRERWAVIEMQLEQRRASSALYAGKLSLVGTKCEPWTRNIR